MPRKNTLDVVFLFRFEIGVPKILTVLRVHRSGHNTIFPEAAGLDWDLIHRSKLLNSALRKWFLVPGSVLVVRNESVRYKVLQRRYECSKSALYRFHVAEVSAFELTLRSWEKVDSYHGIFGKTKWTRLSDLLKRKDGGDLRLEHPQYLALRKLAREGYFEENASAQMALAV
jgi:hypothetical protein